MRCVRKALAGRVGRFLREEDGVTLLELAIVIPVFLFLFFGLIDYGRLGSEYVMAEKAMQIAARTAAVRPPACAGVPEVNLRGAVSPGVTPPRFGTSCRSGANVCANPGTISCTANITNATAAEVWGKIRNALPTHATAANIRFVYTYSSDLGFLGGPYTPIVTVELQNLDFRFATPLGSLAAFATAGAATGPGPTLAFPPMSVSLPAEDLALGENG